MNGVRPPFGFVVEGDGEYASYPSLVCRIVEAHTLDLPRINARGYGGITGKKGLEQHLDDLVDSHEPYAIIVTVDLLDLVEDQLVENCEELRLNLLNRIDAWMEKAVLDGRFDSLPVEIIPIIQIQKLESWMISDSDSLRSNGFAQQDSPFINDADAEENPTKWLAHYGTDQVETKKSAIVKKIFANHCVHTMAEHSKSFDKFQRELCRLYQSWLQSLTAD